MFQTGRHSTFVVASSIESILERNQVELSFSAVLVWRQICLFSYVIYILIFIFMSIFLWLEVDLLKVFHLLSKSSICSWISLVPYHFKTMLFLYSTTMDVLWSYLYPEYLAYLGALFFFLGFQSNWQPASWRLCMKVSAAKSLNVISKSLHAVSDSMLASKFKVFKLDRNHCRNFAWARAS